MGRQSCSECRETYERASRPSPWDRTPPEKKEPPCATCRPELLPESETVAAALARLQGQWLLDSRGVPMALRIEAVESVLRQMDVPEEERLEMLDELMRLAGVMVRCFLQKAGNG